MRIWEEHLKTKLRSLKFRAGAKIPRLSHERRSTIWDYYRLTSGDQLDQISINNILSTLKNSIPEWKSKTRVTSCELRLQIYELRVHIH